MTKIDSGTERGATGRRWRGRGTRLLVAGAGVAVLATVVTPDGAGAHHCASGTPSWPPCQASTPAPGSTSGTPASGWSWWGGSPSTAAPPVTAPPVTAPPATAPPVTPPAVAAPAPLPAHPRAVPDAARRLLELVNQERERAGLRALKLRDDVTAIALAHSTRMAEAGDIFHNRGFFSRTTRRLLGAVVRGENVAYNGSVESAHARLMRSRGHRANLLNPRFSVVGIAVVQAPDGRYFITEDFLQPASRGGRPAPRPPSPWRTPGVTGAAR